MQVFGIRVAKAEEEFIGFFFLCEGLRCQVFTEDRAVTSVSQEAMGCQRRHRENLFFFYGLSGLIYTLQSVVDLLDGSTSATPSKEI